MRTSGLLLALPVLLASCGPATSRTPSEAAEAPEVQMPATQARSLEAHAATTAPEAPATPPTAAAEPSRRPHFRLEWRRGSGAIFGDEISIADDGRFNWVAQVITGSTGTMHAISVQLTEAEIRAVREAIDGADFFSIPANPQPTGVQDGVQLSLAVLLGERVHRIRAEEPLGPQIMRIQRAIEALFTDARRAQLRAAGPPQPGHLSLELLAD